MQKLIVFILITAIQFAIPALAQTIIKHYTTENGLNSNTAYASLSDVEGYLWFATDKGVSRFDGTTFTHFTTDDGLTDNEVFKIYQDKKGRIWFLTYNGIPCFYLQNRFYNPTNFAALEELTYTSFFTQVREDDQNNLWFFKENSSEFFILNPYGVSKRKLTNNSNFLCFLNQKNKDGFVTMTRIDNDLWKYEFLLFSNLENPIFSITCSKILVGFSYINNQFIAASKSKEKEGVHYWIKGSNWNELVQSNETIENESKFHSLTQTLILQHELYAISDNGIQVIDSSLKKNRNILADQYTTSLSIDYSGGVWVTTKTNGVFHLSGTTKSNYANIDQPVYIIRRNPFVPEEIWVVGDTSLIQIKNQDQTNSYNMFQFTGHENTSDFAFLSKDELVIGNGKSLLHFKNGTFKNLASKSGIKQLLIDEDSIYIARSSELTSQSKQQIFLPLDIHNQPYQILHSGRTLCLIKINRRIVAGDNHGAYELDQTTGIEKRIDGINGRVKKILAYKDKIIYASDVSGLWIQQDKSIISVNVNSGLAANSINNMSLTVNGVLWLATNKGISSINLENNEVRNYAAKDGLPNMHIYDLLPKSDSSLLIATATGLYEFIINEKVTSIAPRLNLGEIKINGIIQEYSSVYKLSHTENNIEISMTGIAYNDELRYYYALGTDPKKQHEMVGNTLNFINLPHGTHKVILTCVNQSAERSNQIVIEFQISPPFYETNWFIVVFVITIAGTFFLLFVYLQYRKSYRRKVELLLSETKQKALQAQLNPHFVFNALNSIQYLFMSRRDEEAHEYLSQFSVLLRNILNHSDKSNIAIHEELENLKLYVEIERKRSDNRFSFELFTHPDIDIFQLQIPVMLLQPFLENAIWHGFKNINHHGILRLQIDRTSDQKIRLIISDNGSGFNVNDTGRADSKGIKLIRERIDALNNLGPGKITLEINSSKEGTLIEFTFFEKY